MILTKENLLNLYGELFNEAYDFFLDNKLDILKFEIKNKSRYAPNSFYYYIINDDKIYFSIFSFDRYSSNYEFDDNLFLYESKEEKLIYLSLFACIYYGVRIYSEIITFKFKNVKYKNIHEYVEEYSKTEEYLIKYQNNLIRNITRKNVNVNLSPTLIIESRTKKIDYYLKLKIGINKFYVIKDFSKFFKSVYQNLNVKYGAGLEFIHSLNCFDDVDSIIFNNCSMFYLEEKNKANIGFENFINILNKYLSNNREIEVLLTRKKETVPLQISKIYDLTNFLKYKSNLSFNKTVDEKFILLNKTLYKFDNENFYKVQLDNKILIFINELISFKKIEVTDLNRKFIDNLIIDYPDYFT